MRGAAIVLAGLALAACRGPERAATAAAPAAGAAAGLLVKRGALEDRMPLTGTLEAAESASLVVPRTPNWSATIRWLAEDGQVVKKGDRVVEFDTSALASMLADRRLSVVSASSELASEIAKGTTGTAEKAMDLERKQAALAKARVEASVPADLFPRRIHQEKQMALAREQDAVAKASEDLAAQKRATRMDRRLRELTLTKAERELRLVEERLDDLMLKAPRDGLVQLSINYQEGRKFQVGDSTHPGNEVASIPELSQMQVRARLPDVDEGAVAVGMAAECVLDAYPGRRFGGRVKQVSPVARREGRDGLRRFFDVVVALDKVDQAVMLPGMSVRVEVIRRRATDVLLVPRAALRRAPGARGKILARLASGRDEAVEVDFCSVQACAVRTGVVEGTALAVAVPGGAS